MESKSKDAESKKTIKKEKEEIKKEKVPDTPQPVEKKAVKRTRASTATSPSTHQNTPKRRRTWTRKITFFLPCKLFRRSYIALIAKPLMKMLYVYTEKNELNYKWLLGPKITKFVIIFLSWRIALSYKHL